MSPFTYAVTTPGTAFANDSTTTTTEVTAALDKADAKNGALVATAAPSTTDGDSAAQTAAVDIPADPTKGIKLTDGGQTITIGLPNASQGGKGAKNNKGVVAYSGRDGSANAVVPADNGGVQFLTTIESKKAPTKYDYPVTLPRGGKIVLLDGGAGAIVYDAQNQPLVAVAAPWAKDANGKDVKTYFTTNGKKLTQHVAHKAQGVAYPLVADPFWIPAWAVAQIIRCGFGGYLGYISAAGWDWWWRALAVVGGCLIGVR
ncbi:MAG TPA: hypothetical protein VLA88_01625 [Candidatus Saccharimonadales bacterium]|nr:hypothetical protein [Candidatus Saccharimonadales bacterium]